MWTVAVVCVLTAPFPFIGGGEDVVVGLPVWLWWSLLFTVALSVLTAVGILRYWKDEPADGD